MQSFRWECSRVEDGSRCGDISSRYLPFVWLALPGVSPAAMAACLSDS